VPHRDRVIPLLPGRGRMTRRELLNRGGIALLGLAGGATGARLAAARRGRASPAGPEPGRGGPATEPVAGPPSSSPVVRLEAAETEVDLGGLVVRTWAYGGQVPGPALRVTAGRPLEVRLRNLLPDPTTIHWHGIATPWDQDGVPDLPAPPIGPGASGGYRFAPPDPGTHWSPARRRPARPRPLRRGRGRGPARARRLRRRVAGRPGRLARRHRPHPRRGPARPVRRDGRDGRGCHGPGRYRRRPGRLRDGRDAGVPVGGAGRGRRRRRLPALPGQRAAGGGAGDAAGAARPAGAGPAGQRGRRHGLPGRARRPPADGHPQRRLPGRAGPRSTACWWRWGSPTTSW
jgi:hypothetical protein